MMKLRYDSHATFIKVWHTEDEHHLGGDGMRLLLAEDERDLNAILTQKLSKDGYLVDSCFDGEDALSYLAVNTYDGIILDIMMPKVDGMQVLQSLREQHITTPVLFLTAKDTIRDRVQGLDSGANDYLVKPFSFAELTARIRTMIRVAKGSSSTILKVHDLTMDTMAHRVERGNRQIALSAREYALLEYLMYHRNIVLSRQVIETHIWGDAYEGGSNLVDVYIGYLRKKIDDGFDTRLIHTIRGSGYVIKEPS